MSGRKDEHNGTRERGLQERADRVKRSAVKSVLEGVGSFRQHDGMALVVTWEPKG